MAGLGKPNYGIAESNNAATTYLGVKQQQDGKIILVTGKDGRIPSDRETINKIDPNATVLQTDSMSNHEELVSGMGSYMPEKVQEDTRKIIEKLI